MSALLCKMTVTSIAYKLLALLCHGKLWGMETYTCQRGPTLIHISFPQALMNFPKSKSME